MNNAPPTTAAPSKATGVGFQNRLARAALALVLAYAAGCTADGGPTAPRRSAVGGRSVTDALTGTASQALWSQDTPIGYMNAGLSATQDHVLVADDFVIPASTIWSVSQLVVTGFRGVGPYPPGPMFVGIYQNSNGAPGAQIAGYTLTPAPTTVPRGFLLDYVYTFSLPSPTQLATGTYWIVYECGIYYFECGIVQAVTGHEALIGDRNTGTSIWFPLGISGPNDLSFVLNGTQITPASATTGLEAIVDAMGLAAGTQTSLDAKLNSVLRAIASGNRAQACQLLDAFLSEVSAQTGKNITQAQADALSSQVSQLKTLLGC